MKIKSLIITGIGGIKDLELSFSQGFNVICGANGIGKSTILNIIADAFKFTGKSQLKRNALCEFGEYCICINLTENGNLVDEEKSVRIETFIPNETQSYAGWYKFSEKFLFFGIERTLDYKDLKVIGSDPERKDIQNGQMAVTGINADDIKSWFVNRFLFEDKPGSLTENQIKNFNLAKSVFGILDETVKFNIVRADSLDIMLSTKKGDIYFEYLSDGYKSCFYIILGIIKEIEYRTKGDVCEVQKFDGVVLIDEIDLHLHPSWQVELIKALKKVFPCMQFIVTTHSPSILQSLEKDEIIPLGYDDDGNTCLKQLKLSEYGLQGWTLEEILKDVMDMPATTSELYQNTLKEFDDAMNREDGELIIQKYELLKKMMKHDNPLFKLLSIQVAEWKE